MHTMPRGKLRPTLEEVKALLAEDQDFLRPLVQAVLQELLEAEMTEALGAEKGERTAARLGHRSGYYGRSLVTRVGKLELRVPQDRQGRFSTELFARYQRSEKALVAALAEMYVQGVSTRKVKAITEELCDHSFSAAAISAINARLDQGLAQFAGRRLDEACPYLIVDARGACPRAAFGRPGGAGPRGRRDPQPGGPAGDRHQLGRPPQHPGGRARQPREPLELAGLPAPAARARAVRRRVRRVGRPCRAPAGDRRGPAGGGLAALWSLSSGRPAAGPVGPLPAQCPRLRPAQGRRRAPGCQRRCG